MNSSLDHDKGRRGFASDNYAGICPEAMRLLQEANQGHAVAYGEDEWTKRLCSMVQELFETDCSVYPVFNGTAANALALSQICGPYESIFCHEQSHLATDECGAPSFFSGGSRQILISGKNGKLDVKELEMRIKERSDIHSQPPKVISLAQVTECGTVYTLQELYQIHALCQKYRMAFHMDGARFANAIEALNVTPAEMTWKAGVDVLSFGFTKNGGTLGDLVVFFKKEYANRFEFRCKQAGQLASKSRLITAPMIGLLENGAWLRHAKHANSMAEVLENKLLQIPGLKLTHRREANSVFLHLEKEVVKVLYQMGWHFYDFGPSGYRFMTAWDNTVEDVECFVRDLKVVLNKEIRK